MVYGFGEFELDTTTFELRRGGRVVKLEPKVFDVLRHLVERRERVVTKTELLETLWPGEYVTESALPRAVAAARKALGDDRDRQACIRTVHGRGYQFVARVRPSGRAAPPHPAEEPARDARSTLFVGREAAMGRLSAALADAAAGRGRLVLLFGEPGIGKTRTAEELAGRACERGFEALAGRCYEGEGAPAFWPWVQILRAATEDLEPPELEAHLGRGADAVAHLVPELRERLAAPPPDLPTAPDEARFRLFEGVAEYLGRRAEARPLLLVVDDLHWADKPTVLLLRHLMGRIAQRRVLVVGSYREVELRRGSPLREVVGDLSREPHAERLPLRGLDREAVRRFVEAHLGGAGDESLVSAVADITEGNPFFLSETVRLLRAEGDPPAPASRASWDAALPQGLRDVIGRRLDRLSAECNEVLTHAAVIGTEFGVNVLARFAGVDPERLLGVLDEALHGRLVVESPETLGHYAFAHALIRQSILEEIPTPLRVRFHRRVGEVLEEVYRDSVDAHLDVLAHHFFQAAPGGDVDKAVDYAARAGRAALRLLAWEEAAAAFAQALQALELRVPDDETRRCEILLELGDAFERAGDRARMRDVFTRAADCARRLCRSDLLARAALGFAGRTERGAPDTGMRALLEEALEALGEHEDGLRARLLSYLVGTPPYHDSVETRLELSRRAVALARGAGDAEALMSALGAQCWAMQGPDFVDERLVVADELLALAERERWPEGRFTGLESHIRSYLVMGDTQAADRAIARYRALAEELRQPTFLFIATIYPVARALSTGRFAEAEGHMARGLELGVQIQHPTTGPVYLGWRIFLAQDRGDVDELIESLRAMLSTPWVTDSTARSFASVRGSLAVLEGRREDARRELDAIVADGLARIPHDEHWMMTMATLASLAASLGAAEYAGELGALLLPYAERNVVHDLLRCDRGSVAHFLGMLAHLEGRLDAAVAHLEAALAMNLRMGARPHAARTRLELVETLSRRARPGDRERARTLRAEAEAEARALGMSLRLARLEIPDA